ncbi:hypothetical protein LX36DRAFT_662741 [Colletotrichum falcatum]|nr:hypothetical protein LX36DRAFT_662741 [Colletotrichum falcatum]
MADTASLPPPEAVGKLPKKTHAGHPLARPQESVGHPIPRPPLRQGALHDPPQVRATERRCNSLHVRNTLTRTFAVHDESKKSLADYYATAFIENPRLRDATEPVPSSTLTFCRLLPFAAAALLNMAHDYDDFASYATLGSKIAKLSIIKEIDTR